MATYTQSQMTLPSGDVVKFKDNVSNYQAQLVSGTNIKTVNNTSLLGSGNISVGGGNVTHDASTEAGSAVTLNADQLEGYTLNNLLKLFYPVGSVYQNTSNVNPSTWISGTTWTLISSVALASENVFGNGYSLGLTYDGANKVSFNPHNIYTGLAPQAYGKSVGTGLGDSGYVDVLKATGIPTKVQAGDNPEYTGAVVDTITVYTWERIG